jgi:ParB family transcriptional regulator, chromosome partitioning protein
MSIIKIREVKDLQLDQIDIGLSQARTSAINEGIEELAASIDKIGLLEPIVVFPKEDGRYEVVTGQRRFLAHQYLKLETIRATILAEQVEPAIAKAISLTENMIRQNLPTQDCIDVCTELYKTYGSIKKISEMLGLPYYKISQYVKYEQLIEPLKKKVDNQELKLDIALRVQKAATDSDTKEVNIKAAIVYAEEMKNMSGLQQRQIEKVAKESANIEPEEIIKLSRRQPQINLNIVIGENLNQALQKFTVIENTDRNNAVITLLETALSERGYL